MQYGLEREIEILEYTLRNEAAFVMYVGMTSGGVNSFLIQHYLEHLLCLQYLLFLHGL